MLFPDEHVRRHKKLMVALPAARPPQPPCSTAGCPAAPLERPTTLRAHDGQRGQRMVKVPSTRPNRWPSARCGPPARFGNSVVVSSRQVSSPSPGRTVSSQRCSCDPVTRTQPLASRGRLHESYCSTEGDPSPGHSAAS